MTCKTSISRQERIIIVIGSWTIFLLCSVGLGYFVYLCLEQYFSYPEGVEISSGPQYKLNFPSFTFCSFQNDKKFKQVELKKCGINSDKELNEKFIGSGSPECEDPKQFWDMISLDLSDIGIKQIKVKYVDETTKYIPMKENSSIWTRMITFELGTCFTLTIPKNWRSKDISYMLVIIPKGLNHKIAMTMHQNEMLNPVEPRYGMGYTFTIFKNTSASYLISYVHKKGLSGRFSYGGKCQSNVSYSLTDCVRKKIDEVSMRTLEILYSGNF